MKLRNIFFIVVSLFAVSNASAWTCPSGQIHQQVPKGTAGAVLVEGEYFVCVPNTPPTNPSSQTQSQTQSQSQSQTAKSSSTSDSSAKSTSDSTSNSSVKNSGNSSSISGVKNSGNSSNKNTNTATGGTGVGVGIGGNQSQSATASNNGNGNGNGANNSSYSNVTDIKPAAATAFASATPTASCVIGYGAGGQLIGGGLSFSGGKIDKNCALLEAAKSARNLKAFCKVYITDKYVKAAGVTLEDCMETQAVVPATVVTEKPDPIFVPVPVYLPSEDKTTPVPVPVVTTNVEQSFGTSCRLHGGLGNECKRFLGDAARRLQADPNAKLRLVYPYQANEAVNYMHSLQIDSNRITEGFTETQNGNVSIVTYWTEQK